MFGIGDTELLLIVIFAFLLFGPDKLPAMGRTIGRGLKQFQDAQQSVTKVVQKEVIDPMQQAVQETGQALGVTQQNTSKKNASLLSTDSLQYQQAGAEEQQSSQLQSLTFAEQKAQAEAAAQNAAHNADALSSNTSDSVDDAFQTLENVSQSKRMSAAELYGINQRQTQQAPQQQDTSSKQQQKPQSKQQAQQSEKHSKRQQQPQLKQEQGRQAEQQLQQQSSHKGDAPKER